MKAARLVITLLLMASITTPPAANAQRRGRAARGGGGAAAADLIVSGGTVVTMDASRRVIEEGAVAVRGGRIVAVGPRTEVETKYTSARERVDARGKVVVPGLINGPTHVPM